MTKLPNQKKPYSPPVVWTSGSPAPSVLLACSGTTPNECYPGCCVANVNDCPTFCP